MDCIDVDSFLAARADPIPLSLSRQLPRHSTVATLSLSGFKRGYATQQDPYDVIVIGGGPGGYFAGEHTLGQGSPQRSQDW